MTSEKSRFIFTKKLIIIKRRNGYIRFEHIKVHAFFRVRQTPVNYHIRKNILLTKGELLVADTRTNRRRGHTPSPYIDMIDPKTHWVKINN